jgi:hypothetical protein
MPKIEDILINGDADQIQELMGDTNRVVVVDWREEEQDMLGYFARQLPAGSLSFGFAEDDEARLDLAYNGVRHPVQLTFSGKDRYLVIRALANAIAPGHEIRVFRESLQSDTHSFLVRPQAWWKEMDDSFPGRMREALAPLSEGMDFVSGEE